MAPPKPLFDRVLARLGLQRLGTRNADSYTGAQVNRLTLDWIREPLSADRELKEGRQRLVARSRDLMRNNAYGRRFVKMSQNHVVGAAGIQMRACNEMVNGKPLDAINDALEAAWCEWGDNPATCSTNGRYSWLDLQRLAVSEWKSAGEFLCQLVDDPTNPFGFSLHPIDSDRLDDTHNVKPSATQNEIRSGVEIDRIGRVVAFHILTVHPSDVGYMARATYRERIAAENMIHLYQRDERVDLTRGIPQMVAGMRDARHLDMAQEASVVALRAAAANPLFIETTDPAGEVETPDEDIFLDGDPGTAIALGLGQKVSAPQMSQPRDTYPQLLKAFLRSVAAAFGVSYNQLANDLEGVNLSSLRVGRHEEQETWMAEQELLITHFCKPVFARWLRAALLKGHINGASYDVSRVNRVEWHPRRWMSVDPLKDAQTADLRLALGLDSRTEIKAAEGGDLWRTWDYLEDENEYAVEKKLSVAPPSGGATQPTPDSADTPASGATDTPDTPTEDDAGRNLRVVRGR